MLSVIYNSLTLSEINMTIIGNALIEEINNNEVSGNSGESGSDELDIIVTGHLHIGKINNYAGNMNGGAIDQVEAPTTITTTKSTTETSTTTIITTTTTTTSTTTTTPISINFYNLVKFGVLYQKISVWGPKYSTFTNLTKCGIVSNSMLGQVSFYYYCCDSSENKMIVFDKNWLYLVSYLNVTNGLNSVTRMINNRIVITSPTSVIITDFSCNQIANYNKSGANYISAYYSVGLIYVADYANNVIDLFTSDGSSLTFIEAISLGPTYKPTSLDYLNVSYISAFNTGNNSPVLIKFDINAKTIKSILNITTVSCSSNMTTVSYDCMGYFGLNCATNNMIYVLDTQGTYTLQQLSTGTDPLVSSFVDLKQNLVVVTSSAIYLYRI